MSIASSQRKIRTRAIFIVLVIPLIAIGCGAGDGLRDGLADSQGSSRAWSAADLVVLTPADGAAVSTETVTFTGTAPEGARVVRDISFAPDDSVVAADGTWSLDVQLDEGPNEVTLRLEDIEATARSITVTYAPTGEASTPPAASEAPGAQPSEEVTPTEPPATYAIFGDGTHEVGTDIAAGTYRTREPGTFCYWARLKGFGGSLNDIIANDNANDAYAVVSISSKDAGFESNGCGEWTKDLSRVTNSTSRIESDGTYIVGKDIKAGKWRSSGGDFCYWARLKNFGGTLGSIVANDNVLGGRAIVTIRSTDKGFETTGCGTWKRG